MAALAKSIFSIQLSKKSCMSITWQEHSSDLYQRMFPCACVGRFWLRYRFRPKMFSQNHFFPYNSAGRDILLRTCNQRVSQLAVENILWREIFAQIPFRDNFTLKKCLAKTQLYFEYNLSGIFLGPAIKFNWLQRTSWVWQFCLRYLFGIISLSKECLAKNIFFQVLQSFSVSIGHGYTETSIRIWKVLE